MSLGSPGQWPQNGELRSTSRRRLNFYGPQRTSLFKILNRKQRHTEQDNCSQLQTFAFSQPLNLWSNDGRPIDIDCLVKFLNGELHDLTDLKSQFEVRFTEFDKIRNAIQV